MSDRHEKTHGGYGPTLEEWEKEILPEIHERSIELARESIRDIEQFAKSRKDAGKIYTYNGETHRFMRFAVRALLTLFNNHIQMAAKGAEFRAKRIEALEERVRALDGIAVTKSLDMEAYDAMGDIAARLERIETELQAETSGKIRFRGYWFKGDVAQAGDCYSHNGSTY